MEFNVTADFPLLRNHPNLTYLDSAATTQKPQCVIDQMVKFYETLNANIHRGVYTLSEQATEAFENARTVVQHFIHANESKECIFVKSATEAINLVCSSFGEAFINPGDTILISAMEHHSNLVPWQILCQKKGATLAVIPIDHNGDLILESIESLLTPKVKLLALTQVSNAIGTLNPIKAIIKQAHQHHIPVLIDGTQSTPRIPIDVQDLDCDFFVFSSHKTYGPTGIGVLYGKAEWLDKIPPYQSGGDMVLSVDFSQTIVQPLPHKFEAGTPPIAEAIGLAEALHYLSGIGLSQIQIHEQHLTRLAIQKLQELPFITLVGNPKDRMGNISFVMKGIHPHDIGTILNQKQIAIRTGHHCAMPLMTFFGVSATARLSIGLYNTPADIERLVEGLKAVYALFNRKSGDSVGR